MTIETWFPAFLLAILMIESKKVGKGDGLMDTLIETRAKLESLRIQLQMGKVFASLGRSVGNIIDARRHNLAITPVSLPNEADGIQSKLKEIQKELHQGKLSNVSNQDLEQLLSHLGSPNPLIRDKGIFYIFNDLIQSRILTKKQLIYVYDYLVSDQILFSHIHEKNNDAVYLRSFAVMLLSSLVYIDRAGRQFIDHERKNELVNQLALYIILEDDTRGFDEKNGWIHAYTHIGNVLDELSSDEELIRADKILLLGTLIEKYRRLKTPLIYGEATRISVYIADQLQEDDVYQQFLLIELREWRRNLSTTQVRETQAMWNGIFNRQRLLQAMILNPAMPQPIIEYLEDANDF